MGFSAIAACQVGPNRLAYRSFGLGCSLPRRNRPKGVPFRLGKRLGPQLGATFLTVSLLVGRGSPTKIDHNKKNGTLNLTCLLEDLDSFHAHRGRLLMWLHVCYIILHMIGLERTQGPAGFVHLAGEPRNHFSVSQHEKPGAF